MLKLLFYLVLLFVGGTFLINQFPALKQVALETINPAFKEEHLLAQLGAVLGEVEINVRNAASAKSPAASQSALQKSAAAINQAQVALRQASALNKKQTESGLAAQAFNKIVDLFVDKTPYPADHLMPGGNQAGNTTFDPLQTCLPR